MNILNSYLVPHGQLLLFLLYVRWTKLLSYLKFLDKLWCCAPSLDLLCFRMHNICSLILSEAQVPRAIARVMSYFLRGSRIDGHSQKNQFFFLFSPRTFLLGNYFEKKIVLVSSNLFFERNFVKVRKMRIRGGFNASKHRNNVITFTRLLRRKNNCGLTKLLTNFILLLFFKMM